MGFKIITKITIVTFIALGLLFAGGLLDFYHRIPAEPNTNEEKTDAIIVLTGGSERIAEGIRLLNHGYSQKLFISGVGKETKLVELLETQNLKRKEKRVDFSKMTLGREAINTVGNARETAEWVAANNITSIRLVTANYHMPRSVLEFKKHMPNVKIIPHPVFPTNFTRDNWQSDEATRNRILAEYVKYLMAMIGK